MPRLRKILTLQIDSAINLLRGKAHEAMENRGLAAECFREALRADVYCFEAFENLVNHHMLTAQEGNLWFPDHLSMIRIWECACSSTLQI